MYISPLFHPHVLSKQGYTHIDTAKFHQNEGEIGQAISDSGIPREQLFITGKLWDTDQAAGVVKSAFHQTRLLLQLDYLDLYLIHSPNPGKEARLKAWGELIELQRAGFIRSIGVKGKGVSNFGIHHLKELTQEFPNNPPPAVNQLEVHPWLARKELCEYCKEQGIVVVAYSPLAKAKRPLDPVVLDISSAHQGQQKKSWSQIVLRWNIQKGRAVIPNSTNVERIKENTQIFDFELSEGEMKRLDELDEYFVTSWDPTTTS